MALIHQDASDDFLEKSGGRAALSSMVLEGIVGDGAKSCCGNN